MVPNLEHGHIIDDLISHGFPVDKNSTSRALKMSDGGDGHLVVIGAYMKSKFLGVFPVIFKINYRSGNLLMMRYNFPIFVTHYIEALECYPERKALQKLEIDFKGSDMLYYSF